MAKNQLILLQAALTLALASLTSLLSSAIVNLLPAGFKMNALLFFVGGIVLEFLSFFLLKVLEDAHTREGRWRLIFEYMLSALSAIAAVADGLASNLVSLTLPAAISSYVHAHVLPLLIVVTIVNIVSSILIYSVQQRIRNKHKERAAFLKLLKILFAERMKSALAGAEQIALQLRQNGHAITRPGLDATSADSSICQAYWNANGELLLTGDVGAGKTTLLIQLAYELAAGQFPDKPDKLPVIFNLETWANKRQPLAEWMKEELKSDAYNRKPKVAANMIKDEKILPLLDGLNEVAIDHLDACIHVINEYHQKHPETPLVVCCPTDLYNELPSPLNLPTVVEVEPLDYANHIIPYLDGRTGLEGVREALRDDGKLREVVKTPLLLYVLTHAYQDCASTDIPRPGDTKTWLQLLWNDYVHHTMTQPFGVAALGKVKDESGEDEPGEDAPKSNKQRWWICQRHQSKPVTVVPYTEDETRRYLSWLAAQLTKIDETEPVFYLEHMQWSWLPNAQTSKRPLIKLTGNMTWAWVPTLIWMGSALAVALVVGVPLCIFVDATQGFANGIVYGARYGLPFGAAFGLLGFAFSQVGESMLTHHDVDTKNLPRPGTGVTRSRRNGVIGGLAIALAYVLGIGIATGGVVLLVGGLATVISPTTPAPLWLRGNGLWEAGLAFGLGIGLLVGLPAGFLTWDTVGGGAYMRFRSLHAQLEEVGVIPHDFLGFLHFAKVHRFLKRYGAGYEFFHPTLRAYFKQQWDETWREYVLRASKESDEGEGITRGGGSC